MNGDYVLARLQYVGGFLRYVMSFVLRDVSRKLFDQFAVQVDRNVFVMVDVEGQVVRNRA